MNDILKIIIISVLLLFWIYLIYLSIKHRKIVSKYNKEIYKDLNNEFEKLANEFKIIEKFINNLATKINKFLSSKKKQHREISLKLAKIFLKNLAKNKNTNLAKQNLKPSKEIFFIKQILLISKQKLQT